MFENPRRGRQARNFTTNVPKILVLKSSSEQIFSRKLPLGAPEVELRGCDHDLRTMIEHFPLTARYFIYSIPKAKCRPGHLNVNSLNIAIGHSLHLQSLHHNPHYHQHQHQGDLTLG